MNSMVVLTPSYAPDFELCARLNRSLLDYGAAQLRHRIVVPPEDVALFRQLEGPRTEVVSTTSLLPRGWVRIARLNLMVNLRRPFPPVRGWIAQQLVKLAAAAASTDDVLLIADSDVEFIRPFSADDFVREDAGQRVVRFFRLPDGVNEALPRHLIWHRVARELLGLPAAPPPPLPDYICGLVALDPALVRRMLARVEQVTRRRWIEAIAAQLHFSEYTLYGVFVDSLGADPAASWVADTPLCHVWYEADPLDEGGVAGFVAARQPDDVACMISAKSHTSEEVRQAAMAALRAPLTRQ